MKAGKKPFYLKKGELRKAELVEKYKVRLSTLFTTLVRIRSFLHTSLLMAPDARHQKAAGSSGRARVL